MHEYDQQLLITPHFLTSSGDHFTTASALVETTSLPSNQQKVRDVCREHLARLVGWCD